MTTRDDRLSIMQNVYAAACGGSPIPGHPGYFATRDGAIYTVLSGRGLRPAPVKLARHTGKDGYPRVRLSGRRYFVHRLVALTFIGPIPEGLETRHLNGVRSDARAENLAYGTAKENAADRVLHGTELYGERSPFSRWSDAEVRNAIALYRQGGITQREVGELLGTSQQVVSRWIKAANADSRTRYVSSVA